MSVVLYRIDDRLIHGQVVVGWGQRLGLEFIALVDDAVKANGWEQELYRAGVPPQMELIFAGVEEAAGRLAEWERDPRRGIVLVGDVATMAALCAAACGPKRVNLGGIHAKDGRRERLRYVYLSAEEETALQALAARGVEVSAQDVPTAKPVPLGDLV